MPFESTVVSKSKFVFVHIFIIFLIGLSHIEEGSFGLLGDEIIPRNLFFVALRYC